MRIPKAWAILAAAALAAGCGGGGVWEAEGGATTGDGFDDDVTTRTEDGFDDDVNARTEDGVCDVCKATGGGVFHLDGDRLTFGLNAIPKDPTPGSGFGGEGFAASGHVQIQLHGQGQNVHGTVDTILRCEVTGSGATASFGGELRDGGRFVVTVEDAGEPGRDDTISFTDGVSFGPAALEQGGNLQVHDFEVCEPPPAPPQCPEQQCWSADIAMCVPCVPPPPPPPPPPPQCPAGQCWSDALQRCEPCFVPL